MGVLGLNGVGREVQVVAEVNEHDNDGVGLHERDGVGRDVHVVVVAERRNFKGRVHTFDPICGGLGDISLG